MNKSVSKRDRENAEKLSDEFIKLFNEFSQIEGLIVRGHILIEQALNKQIKQNIKNKTAYNPDKLSFSNKLMIADMLGITRKLTRPLRSLNKLRNQIAHSLDYDNKLILSIISDVQNASKSSVIPKNSIEENVASAIAYMCGWLSYIK